MKSRELFGVFADMIDSVLPAIGAGVLVGICAIATIRPNRRAGFLRAKYGDTFLAQRILNRGIWTGQLAEELRDSLGTPTYIEQIAVNDDPAEIWSFEAEGEHRSELRFSLKGGVVLAWEWKEA